MGSARIVPEQHGYGILLVLVIASFVVQVAAPDTDFSRLVVVWLGAVTLVFAVRVARAGHRLIQVGAVVAGVLAIGSTAMLLVEGEVGQGVTAIVSGLLVGLAPPVIAAGVLRDMRVTQSVTLHTLAGVLAIYVLAGMCFSFIYTAIGHFESAPFFAEVLAPNRSDYLYFSYVTLTTTGFGDLTAESDLGRTFVVVEALFGQIYLVTIVALIVTNLRPRAARDRTRS